MKNNQLNYMARFLFLGLTLVFYACSGDGKKSKESEQPVRTVNVPQFNEDSAYAFIQNQVDFGPRVPNSVGHRATKDFLVKKLTSYGWTVQLQEWQEKAYTGELLYLSNIIASIKPEATKRILLAAHWDTRPFADKDSDRIKEPIDGANDGGSGVGVLLEVARIMQLQAPEVGVDIILFDGEDYGVAEFDNGTIDRQRIWYCMGSQYWSKNKHKANYMAYYGILLDMVGAKDALFYKEGESMNYAPAIVNKVWTAANAIGFGHIFVNRMSPGIIDDHVFVNRDAKIPMIDIIDYDPVNGDSYFPDYHHTHKDNMDIIDKEVLKAVGQTVLHVLYHE